MSVAGNSGFDSNSFTLDIDDGYTVLTDADGLPIVQKSSAFDGAYIGSAVNESENRVCVTVAMDAFYRTNGDLFTIYVNPNDNVDEDFVNIVEVDPYMVLDSISYDLFIPGTAGTNHIEIEDEDGVIHYGYYRGDANDDNSIDSKDASTILVALKDVDGGELEVDAITSTYKSYFSDVISAKQPDANKSGWINSSDASIILSYSASAGAGNEYTGAGYLYVGKLVMVN